jgi:hypothetical protein
MARDTRSNVTIAGDVAGSNVQIQAANGTVTINGQEIPDGTYDTNGGTVTVDTSRDAGNGQRR